jgi:hypothetical protein
MPKFFPTEPQQGTPGSERRVWDALSRLDPEWRVFHSVAWQSERAGREGDGEADFVLLHPRSGIVVLEVKGGELAIDRGRWTTLNRGTGAVHDIKNPFEQAKASKHALLKHLTHLFGRFDASICHGAVLPEVTVDTFIGLDAPRDITIDASDLTNMPAAIDRLLRHWQAHSSFNDSDISKLTNVLAPSTRLVTTLKARIAQTLMEQIDLTARQVFALGQLRRNRRGVVLGPAGSGKTILATERARQLALDGFDVLLTCFNRPLADAVATDLSPIDGVSVATFHSLCMSQLRAAGISPPDDPPAPWWDDVAPASLVEASGQTGFAVGAVVVDEGQDFSQEWLDALQLLLRDPDDGPFYVFADPLQAIRHTDWGVPREWPVFELDINCRSTMQIARRVAMLFDLPVAALGTEGQPPLFVRARDVDETVEVAAEVIENLLTSEHLRPEQCVVLAASNEVVRRLREKALSDYTFVGLGKKGVVVETIQRFKGLEAEVAVVALTSLDLEIARDRALAYVGLSRARAMLIAIGPKDAQQLMHWGQKASRSK